MLSFKPDIFSSSRLNGLKSKFFTCLNLTIIACSINIFPVTAQQIIIDGNTNTNLLQNGNVTNIVTTTIVNGKAFNSFSVFNVEQGKVVNLIIPSNSSHLINLVRDQATNISGVLNALKDNHVGGNVILINPHGIAVSSSGVVNVGSLTAITPTQNFVDNFFDSPGNPNPVSVDTVLNGNVPINNNAFITNAGQINAIEDVKLDTSLFTNSGDIYTNAIFQENNIALGDVVNINTLQFASDLNDLILNNGRIIINAKNAIVNDGNIVSGKEIAMSTEAGDISGNGLFKTTNFVVDAGGSFGTDQNLVRTEISGKASIQAENGIYLQQQKLQLKADKLATRNGNISVEAPDNDVFIDNISAPGKVHITSGGQWVKLGQSRQAELKIEMTKKGGRVDLTDAYVSNSAKIRADYLYGNFYGTGKNPLQLDLMGVNDNKAETIIIGITSPHNSIITNLAARSATLNNFVDTSSMSIQSFDVDNLLINGPFDINGRPGGGLFPDTVPVSSVSIAMDTGLFSEAKKESKAEIGADIAQSSRSAEEMEQIAAQARRRKGKRTTATELVEIVDPQLYLSKYYENYTVQILDKAYQQYLYALASNKTEEQATKAAIHYLIKSKMNPSVAAQLIKRQPFSSNAYYKKFLKQLEAEKVS